MRVCHSVCARACLHLPAASTSLAGWRGVKIIVIRCYRFHKKLILSPLVSPRAMKIKFDSTHLGWDAFLLQSNPITGPWPTFIPYLTRTS